MSGQQIPPGQAGDSPSQAYPNIPPRTHSVPAQSSQPPAAGSFPHVPVHNAPNVMMPGGYAGVAGRTQPAPRGFAPGFYPPPAPRGQSSLIPTMAPQMNYVPTSGHPHIMQTSLVGPQQQFVVAPAAAVPAVATAGTVSPAPAPAAPAKPAPAADPFKNLLWKPDTGMVFDKNVKGFRAPTEEEISYLSAKFSEYPIKPSDSGTATVVSSGTEAVSTLSESSAVAPSVVPSSSTSSSAADTATISLPEASAAGNVCEETTTVAEPASNAEISAPQTQDSDASASDNVPPIAPLPTPPAVDQISLVAASAEIKRSESSVSSVSVTSTGNDLDASSNNEEDGDSEGGENDDDDDHGDDDGNDSGFSEEQEEEDAFGKKRYSKEELLKFRFRGEASAPSGMNTSIIREKDSQQLPRSQSKTNMTSKGGIVRDSRKTKPGRDKRSSKSDLAPLPIPAAPIEFSHRTENRWVHDAVAKDAEEATDRKAKVVLNKMTQDNYGKLRAELVQEMLLIVLQFESSVVDIIRRFTETIFEKAVWERFFCEMYSKLCSELCKNHWTKLLPAIPNEALTSPEAASRLESIPFEKHFKEMILNACREHFMKGVDFSVLEGLTGEERDEKDVIIRKKMSGTVHFIGELYNQSVLIQKYFQLVLRMLLGVRIQEKNPPILVNPEPHEIEQVCELLTVAGQKLELEDAGIFAYALDRMKTLSDLKDIYPSRIRFMLKDVVDLVKGGWKSKKAKQKSKSEVEKDVRREQMEKTILAEGPAGRGGYRRGGPNPVTTGMMGRGGRGGSMASPSAGLRRGDRGSDRSTARLPNPPSDDVKLAPNKAAWGSRGDTSNVGQPRIQDVPQPPIPSIAAVPQPQIADDVCRKRLMGTMDEYAVNGDLEEAINSLLEVRKESFQKYVILDFLLRVFDAKLDLQQKWTALFLECFKTGVYSVDDVCDGLQLTVVDVLEKDLECDIPKLWSILASMFAPLVLSPISVSVDQIFRTLKNVVTESDEDALIDWHEGVAKFLQPLYHELSEKATAGQFLEIQESFIENGGALELFNTSNRHADTLSAFAGSLKGQALKLDLGMFFYSQLRSGTAQADSLEALVGRHSVRLGNLIVTAVLHASADAAAVKSLVTKWKLFLQNGIAESKERKVSSMNAALDYYDGVGDEFFVAAAFETLHSENVWDGASLKEWKETVDRKLPAALANFVEKLV
eukprot:ANDGO_02824.mRNA.1 Eukaryotic translation initiation factor 4G